MFVVFKSLCTCRIASAKVRVKTVLGHLNCFLVFFVCFWFAFCACVLFLFVCLIFVCLFCFVLFVFFFVLFFCRGRHGIRPYVNIQGTVVEQSTRGSLDKNGESVQWGKLPIEMLLGTKLCVSQRGTLRQRSTHLWVEQWHRWKSILSYVGGERTLHSPRCWGITSQTRLHDFNMFVLTCECLFQLVCVHPS